MPRPKTNTNPVIYDIFLWVFTVIIDLFFREIHPRSSWRIPKKGPVIFVAAPHANQFIDPLILMRVVRHDAHRRIAFLVAEKSMRRAFIGACAGLVGSVPVGRALDLKKAATGKIYLPHPDDDPTLLTGTDVDFTSEQFMPGGLIVLPSVKNASANAEIEEIVSQTELRLKKPFKGDTAYKQLTGRPLENGHASANGDTDAQSFEGVNFSVAPHVDQNKVYEAVFDRIKSGGCIGIFPEGGSHDRTELLPLKAGLAIMALGALAENPDCGVTIVPVGMNYFHAHKFRSRAVIEFGAPIEIEPHLVSEYKNGDRRHAIGKVLETVYERLSAVTVQAPDYDTLMLIQAVRRLYNPKGKKLPLPFIIELNRRLIKGYKTYKDDPRIIAARKDILQYNRDLFRLNIRDHQVSYARYPWYKVIATFIFRLAKVMVLALVSLPGVILFSPVFILGKLISKAKAKEALAASTVKVKARDVMATWKILVSLALAPTLDVMYTVIAMAWTWHDRVRGWVPEWVPIWLVGVFCIFFFPAVCFGALRFGEIGMDILKSLYPLLLCINPTQSNTIVKLRVRRERLQEKVTHIIGELGPELFPDFDQNRIIADPKHPLHSPERSRPTTPTHRRDGSEVDGMNFTPISPSAPSAAVHALQANSLPRNESFKDIGSVGIFASHPSTPHRSRSRSRSNSHDIKGASFGFTSIDGKDGTAKANLDEVSKSLKEAMRERGRRRMSDAAQELDVISDEEGEEDDGEEAKKNV